MIFVKDLVEVIKQNSGEKIIRAILPNGDEVNVGIQQYVEDSIYYMFCIQKNEIHAKTLDGLKTSLENEASDSAWDVDPLGFGGGTHFKDCEVMFANCEVDNFEDADDDYFYNIEKITVEDDIVYLHCEDLSKEAASEDVVESNDPNTYLVDVIKQDCRHWETLNNKDRLLEEYMYLNECKGSRENGLYQLILNGCELWYGTLAEINAIVKTMIIRMEKNDFLE